MSIDLRSGMGRPAAPLIALLAALLVGSGPLAGCARDPGFNGQLVEPLEAVPDLTGVNWDGEPFRLSDLEGRVAVVFFGYTYCPDVCPFALAKMKQLYAGLGDRAGDVGVVFVSVDPQRDSVEKLGRYVPNFDERFYGVRLEEGSVEATADAFDLTVQYGQPEKGPGTESYYYVDHTGSFFIVDREGRLRLRFPPDATADQMLPDIERLLSA